MEGNEESNREKDNSRNIKSYINNESQTAGKEESSKEIEKINNDLDVAKKTIKELQNTNIINLEKKTM